MALPVCPITDVSARILARLPDNPGGIPARVGWDGKRIAVFTDFNKHMIKSLPNLRVEIHRGMQLDEIETALCQAVAKLQQSLPPALAAIRRKARA